MALKQLHEGYEMATSDNTLLGISDSVTYKKWTDSEFCILTHFDSETHSAQEETFLSVVLLLA